MTQLHRTVTPAAPLNVSKLRCFLEGCDDDEVATSSFGDERVGGGGGGMGFKAIVSACSVSSSSISYSVDLRERGIALGFAAASSSAS